VLKRQWYVAQGRLPGIESDLVDQQFANMTTAAVTDKRVFTDLDPAMACSLVRGLCHAADTEGTAELALGIPGIEPFVVDPGTVGGQGINKGGPF
jgi:hypothetical protein